MHLLNYFYTLKLRYFQRRISNYSSNFNAKLLAFASDFGDTDAVATCHQMIHRIDKRIKVINFNNNIPKFNISAASTILERIKDFPHSTVLIAVCDPGVGTHRKSIVIKTSLHNLYLVGPNNGIFSDVVKVLGLKSIYELRPNDVNKSWFKGTFDGRDLYAIAGGMLCSTRGRILDHIATKIDNSLFINLAQDLGVEVNDNCISAKVASIDEPFGNIWTMVNKDHLDKIGIKSGDLMKVKISNSDVLVKFCNAFGDVNELDPVCYLDSRHRVSAGYLSIAINRGDFREKYAINIGDLIEIQPAK